MQKEKAFKKKINNNSLDKINKNIIELVEKEITPHTIATTNYEIFEGVSSKEIQEVEQNVNVSEHQNMVSILATNEAAGAFNNYYNKSGDNFTAQVLGASKNRFIKVTGKVSNNSSGYSKFKGHINKYESNVINSMNYAKNVEEVGKWVSNISTFVQIAATGGTILAGPYGWGVALTYISRAALFAKFSAWTSIAYATYARMDYSIAAAKEQNNASKMMTATYFPNVTWSFPTIYM